MGRRRWTDYIFQGQQRWWIEVLLFPLLVISWIYGVVVRVRTALYQRGFFKTRQLPCKVISVGNITLGGTGKTPLAASLARELHKEGVKIGIVSRGYKGLRERRGGVLSDGKTIYLTPREAGDEPYMLATMVPGVAVLVGRHRYTIGQYAHDHLGIDVLILDDGFQHLRIKRDLDIVLINARGGFDNRHLFPRGPLREPLRGLRRASVLVLSKIESSQAMGDIERVLNDLAPEVPRYHSRYKPVSLVEVASGKVLPPQFVRRKKVLAFAGIVDQGYFTHLLRELGAQVVKEVHFPDHHHYTPKDIRMIREYRDKVDVFVTTEKDYVKLQVIPLNSFPLFVLGIEHEIVEGSFYSMVLSALSSKSSLRETRPCRTNLIHEA